MDRDAQQIAESGVDRLGQAEPAYYWFNAGAGRDFFRQDLEKVWGLGPPDTDLEDWRRRSPSLQVDRIDAPVLMQLPEQEARQSPELKRG